MERPNRDSDEDSAKSGEPLASSRPNTRSPDGGSRNRRVPTVLPYSSDISQSDMELLDPESTSSSSTGEDDNANADDSLMPNMTRPKPVIRNATQTGGLQLKYYELQMELKRLRDELRLLGKLPDASDDTYRNDTVENPEPMLNTQENLLDSNTVQTTTFYALKSENRRLLQQNEDLKSTELQLQQQSEKLQEEMNSLKQHVQQLEQAQPSVVTNRFNQNTELNGYNESSGPALTSRPIASDDMEHLKTELDYTRQELSKMRSQEEQLRTENEKLSSQIRESIGTKRGSNESVTVSEELERLQAELRRNRNSKSHISAMLDEQISANEANENLLSEAEGLIADLHSQLASMQQEQELSVQEITKLNEDLVRAQEATDSKSKEVEQLNIKLATSDSEVMRLKKEYETLSKARAEDKSLRRELEVRIMQQQEEIKSLNSQINTQKESLDDAATSNKKSRDRIAELHAKVEESEKRYKLLGEVLSSESKDLSDCKNELDQLRNLLQAREEEIDQKTSEITHLQAQNKKHIDDLNVLTREKADLERAKNSEISKLETMVESLNAKCSDTEKKYETRISRLNQQYADENASANEKFQDENDKLNSEKVRVENELSEQIISLKREKLDLGESKKKAENQVQNLKLSVRHLETQVKNSDEMLSDKIRKLSEAEEAIIHSNAQVTDLRKKCDDVQQVNEALKQKLAQSERTISQQAIQLNGATTEDIGALKQQAQEGAASAKELASFRDEVSRNVANWNMVYSGLQSELQKLQESNQSLSQQITWLKGTEKDRQEQFESTLRASLLAEVEVFQKKYEYSIEGTRKTLDATKIERDRYQNDYFNCNRDLQELQFQLNSVQQTLNQRTKEYDMAREELNKLQSLNDQMQQSKDELSNQIENLESRLKEALKSLESKNLTGLSVQQDLHEAKIALESEVSARLHAEAKSSKQKEQFDHYAECFLLILQFNEKKIKSLIFTKNYFTKCFPRTDIILDAHGGARQRPRMTWRTAFLVALAVSNFRGALAEGSKRKADESRRFLEYQ